MSDTDTPRTDAFYNSNLESKTASLLNHDWKLFARQLERELAQAIAEGRRQMREEARRACKASEWPNEADRNIAYKCADAIHAIPLKKE